MPPVFQPWCSQAAVRALLLCPLAESQGEDHCQAGPSGLRVLRCVPESKTDGQLLTAPARPRALGLPGSGPAGCVLPHFQLGQEGSQSELESGEPPLQPWKAVPAELGRSAACGPSRRPDGPFSTGLLLTQSVAPVETNVGRSIPFFFSFLFFPLQFSLLFFHTE